MGSGTKLASIPLSRLSPSRRDPRKVKPSRESHERLVALIRAHGLLQPLVVRVLDDKEGHYEVIAGHRRLRALREIHRNDGDLKIPCVLRQLDSDTADAISLGENFAREAMHPLDEAEAFDKLASRDGKDADAIGAIFGVTARFVRQRMKLAGLAGEVKAAYRAGEIDTAVAEAFAAVPPDRQLQVWQDTGGHPRHAEHVRNVIAHDWLDASHALFDVSALPESVVSRDLFCERVLIERQAFLAAQAKALAAERTRLIEDGWKEVVAARYEDVQDQVRSTDLAEREFDPPTLGKLQKLAERREALEARIEQTPEDDSRTLESIERKLESIEEQEREIEAGAPVFYSEATKSLATVFLMLLPDGQVRREYRVPRRRHASASGNGSATGETGGTTPPAPPTPDDLADRQRAVTFTHQALAVRQALLKSVPARKRLLAMVLHEKVRCDALAMRHEPNGTTLHAEQGEGFSSPALDALRALQSKLDPFIEDHSVDDQAAYDRLAKLPAAKLDALIDLLLVQCLTAHLQRPTPLVQSLAAELKVNVRDVWCPDAVWLSGFQKIQLAQLVTELRGAVHAPSPERKKSELVEQLATLFSDAAQAKLDDKQLAERVNRWLPSNLRADDGNAEAASVAAGSKD
jgi:ParB family transcriptional regulator, chromosome partitioning protein